MHGPIHIKFARQAFTCLCEKIWVNNKGFND
jgi:hypothetical protein